MNTPITSDEAKRRYLYVLKHGKAKFVPFSDGDDAEVGPREPDYIGHRLGQVWAYDEDPTCSVERHHGKQEFNSERFEPEF